MEKKDSETGKKILSQVLASESVLFFKTRNFHWNFVWPTFNDRHKMLNDIYDMLFEEIDSTAESIRKIWEYSPGSMKEFLATSSIQEQEWWVAVWEDVLSILAEDFQKLCDWIWKAAVLAEDIQCYILVDLFTVKLAKYKKTLWFLKSNINI